MIYRRNFDGTTWHFCRTCSQWPLNDFEEESTVSGRGALCSECKAKRAIGDCLSASLPPVKQIP
jgi:hypothetical protein